MGLPRVADGPILASPPFVREVEAAIGELMARGEVRIAPWRGIAWRIRALLEHGDFALDHLVHLASADPAVAARVLAEAARAGGAAPASLPLAVARIGHGALLAIAREAARACERGPLDGLRRAAWRAAVGSALLSRALARARGLDGDAAWLCGLLHDVGGLAGLAAVERLSAGARFQRGPSPHWERCLERWHVPLGLSLAAQHGLPAEVVDAISLHHSPSADLARSRELVRVVRTADAVLRALGEAAADPQDEEAIAALTEDEATRLAPALVVLPRTLAALEAREPAREAPGPGVGPLAAPVRERRGEGVRLRLAGAEYVATGVAPHQLVVRGAAPLGEGAVLEVEPLDRRGAPFHARVLLSWAEGARFGAVLAPFALGWPAVVAWEGRAPLGARA